MERTESDLGRGPFEQHSDDVVANLFDLELAAGYIANSETSLEMTEEFAAADQEGFQ
jgi:hypothetical protein